MENYERIAGCTPDGKLDLSFEKYLESLDYRESSGGKLNIDELWLVSLWQSIVEANSADDREALYEYESVLNRVGKPKSGIEKFLYNKAIDGLRSLCNSNDDYVWECVVSKYC